MLYPIHNYGDPILREEAEAIESVDDEVRQLAEDMLETMRAEQGVGLAAQQIGKTVAICVVDMPSEYDQDEEQARLNPDVKMPLILINPEILEFSEEKDSHDEGCLSFPGVSAPIQRPLSIVVRYTDIEGREQELGLKGFLARVAQHEIDHLNGVLFIDKMSQVKRIALSGRLKRLKKETQAGLVNG